MEHKEGSVDFFEEAMREFEERLLVPSIPRHAARKIAREALEGLREAIEGMRKNLVGGGRDLVIEKRGYNQALDDVLSLLTPKE